MNKKLVFNFNLVKKDFTGFEKNKAMIIDRGLILWIGELKKLPRKWLKNSNYQEINLQQQNVLPSFIECHTHTVFAGSRADEFELRNQGVSYLEIAKKGGGILSTMKKTRKASQNELVDLTFDRVLQFMKQGVSTLEIKSGYALDKKNEIKMLEVIDLVAYKFKKQQRPHLIKTFLGAHAKPPEFASYNKYLTFLEKKVLPEVKKKNLAQRVDIFIEKNFFEASESESFLRAAQKMGFDLTLHANQLTLSGGADLALKLQACSADHVIQLTPDLIESFARSQTVAVLLPAADLYMRCAYPPARQLIDAGATVALATDFNPGSCPTQDLSLVGLLARLEMKMTLPEVFKAYTINAAKALKIDHLEGELALAKKANFISTYAEIPDFFYKAGEMPKHQLFIGGNKVSFPAISINNA